MILKKRNEFWKIISYFMAVSQFIKFWYKKNQIKTIKRFWPSSRYNFFNGIFYVLRLYRYIFTLSIKSQLWAWWSRSAILSKTINSFQIFVFHSRRLLINFKIKIKIFLQFLFKYNLFKKHRNCQDMYMKFPINENES